MTTVTDNPTQVRAQAKWVRMSARKARIVLDTIRGRTVPEARTILAFTSRAAAVDIELVLRSAVANAEANHGLDGDELVVAEAYADEGPTLKRWRARARGRVNQIKKRTCHITVVLSPTETQRLDRPPKAATPEEASSPQPKAADKAKSSRRRKKTEGAAV